MNTYSKALCWAASLILMALGNAAGLVDDTMANTLFVVLPIVAVLGLRKRSTCGREVQA
jgi:hypothetical protein